MWTALYFSFYSPDLFAPWRITKNILTPIIKYYIAHGRFISRTDVRSISVTFYQYDIRTANALLFFNNSVLIMKISVIIPAYNAQKVFHA